MHAHIHTHTHLGERELELLGPEAFMESLRVAHWLDGTHALTQIGGATAVDEDLEIALDTLAHRPALQRVDDAEDVTAGALEALHVCMCMCI